MKIRSPLPERFWSHVDQRSACECWPWTAARYPDNYGMVGIRNQGRATTMRAHALALTLATAEDAAGRFALHHCDNPPCCNPRHLYWGNQVMNIADMDRRGRSHRPVMVGVDNPRAKLREDDVRAIRDGADLLSQDRLAELFGVSQQVISGIIRGAQWKHVA